MFQKRRVHPVRTTQINDLCPGPVELFLLQQHIEDAASVFGRLVAQLIQGVEVTSRILEIVNVIEARLYPRTMPLVRTAHLFPNLLDQTTRTTDHW